MLGARLNLNLMGADGIAKADMPGKKSYPKAFSSLKIGSLELKNRLVVSAMVTNYCEPNGMPSEKYIAYHEHKARGGWGLIITEDYVIGPHAGGFVRLPGLYSDELADAHQALTQRVHAAGGKIAAQIYHAGRETTSSVTGEPIVGPSAVREPSMPETPRELSVDEIHDLVHQFAQCASYAKKAGFDAVEVHGAHGYLIGAFASPFSNKRTDEYGGSTRNRARFACEVIEAIKEECGKDYPVIYRMSANEYVPGGLELAESMTLARLVEQAGADCIHVSQGVYCSTQHIIPPAITAPAAYVDNAAAIKSVVNVPVIAVGRINGMDVAESVLESDKADLVTMARASLADPELPVKAAAGRLCDAQRCIGCVQGCAAESSAGRFVRCLVNPLTGMEDEYDLSPASKPKRVMVAGGGVSGCMTAIVAAYRGHHVTLVEKSGRLGGQWSPASVPLGKSDFASLITWQRHMLEKLGVRVLLDTVVDRELVELYSPDALVVATGSRPLAPAFIKGAESDSVVTAHDVLGGIASVSGHVVVVGGGLVGAETADMLAQSCRVEIVEMMPEIMRDGEHSPSLYLKERLEKSGAVVHVSTKVVEISEHKVLCERNGSEFVIDEVDAVVLALGVKTDRTLLDQLGEIGCEVMEVGDAAGVKNGYLGIREGYEAGLRL